MSYLKRLAARALGLTESAVRPRLAPYFAPELPAQPQGTRVWGLVEARPSPNGGASPQANRLAAIRDDRSFRPQAVPAAMPRPGEAGEMSSRLSEAEGPHLQPQTATAAAASREPGGASLLHGETVLVPQPGNDASAAGPRPATTVHLTAYRAEAGAAAPAPPDSGQATAEAAPTVHIRIGRVEVRAVPPPQGTHHGERARAGAGRSDPRSSSTSLEAYLAGQRGGGS